MIFAAGFGTRMRPLTNDRPKPLIPVAGRPLIDHALGYVAGAGIKRIVANTHYRGEQLQAHLGPKGVLIADESNEILDTGGGLKAALPLLDSDPVFTLNPDVLWLGPNPLTVLRQSWDAAEMDVLLLCTPLARTHGRAGGGDFAQDATGQITRPGDLVYGGAQIVKTDLLRQLPDRVFSMNVIWDQMNAAGRLRLVEYPGEWCDVGTPEGIPLAERLLETHGV